MSTQIKKDSEIKPYPLCLGSISKDLTVHNIRKTGLSRYVYDFSVDCNTINFSDIVDIHKYVMKKHNMKCLNYWSKCLLGGKSCQKYLIYDLAYKNPHMVQSLYPYFW